MAKFQTMATDSDEDMPDVASDPRELHDFGDIIDETPIDFYLTSIPGCVSPGGESPLPESEDGKIAGQINSLLLSQCVLNT